MNNNKILIVEDESIVAKDIEMTLKHLGYDVVGNCDNGDDAYKAALEKKPDLLLMDIFIKGDKDGIQTAAKIKEQLNIPVIYLTAFSDENTLKRAKETRPHGYLTKPFDEKDLYITLEMVLSRSKLEQDLEAEKQKSLMFEQKARELAEQENKNKDLILSTLSHELRTPLANILAWSEILQANSVNQETLEQGLKIIERNAKAQSMLVNDLLDVSSMILGKMKINKEKMSCYEVLEIALSSIKPFAADKSIQIHNVFLAKNDIISGDALRLQQVFWNLLQNALKFTPKNGEIRVTVHNKDSAAGVPSIVIEIKDTGQGIPPDMLDKVFERFYQGTSTQKGGLGLGLAIVKELVSLHGGSIRAKSSGLGTGSTFIVELPLLKEQNQ